MGEVTGSVPFNAAVRQAVLPERFGPVVAAAGSRRFGMNKVATVSWWSVAILAAIVVLALVLAGR